MIVDKFFWLVFTTVNEFNRTVIALLEVTPTLIYEARVSDDGIVY